jgi:restriction system protein
MVSDIEHQESILQMLKNLRGMDLLEIVCETMKSILNDYDRQPLPSQPGITRWNNNAQWSRNIMVQEGLLKR